MRRKLVVMAVCVAAGAVCGILACNVFLNAF